LWISIQNGVNLFLYSLYFEDLCFGIIVISLTISNPSVLKIPLERSGIGNGVAPVLANF
jgi:hypothetical protein